MAVVLDQVCARPTRCKMLDDFLDLIVLQPWIDDLQLLPQHRQHHNFGKILAQGLAWDLVVIADR